MSRGCMGIDWHAWGRVGGTALPGRRGRSGEEWSWLREEEQSLRKSWWGRAWDCVGKAGGWLGWWVNREEGEPREAGGC